jgi:uncharacterized caspase-like protein
MRLAAALAWCVVVLLAGIAAGHAEKRVALVIGNGGYQNTPQLANPVNDAEDVSAALQQVGFTVILERNLTKRGMEGALAQFARQAQDAGTVLIYFAGHGMQYAGGNYLMPVDARLEDEFSVNFELTRMDDVLFALDRAQGVKIVVLDACRNNPLTERLTRRTSSRAFAATRGLARIEAAGGMVIAYSTQPNQIAVDGNGRNSPFAQAFVKQIAVPGLEVTMLFRRVAAEVNRETAGKQLPELSMSLLDEFYLNNRETDLQAWAKIRETADTGRLNDFIAQYPDSVLASDARLRLAAIERTAADRLTRETAEQRLDAERLVRDKAELQRLETERLVRDKAVAEARETAARQERERIAAENAARQERDRREQLAAQQPAPQAAQPPPANPAANVQTAMLPPAPPVGPPASALPQPAGTALVREIKTELKRLGCHAGPVDEVWDGTRPSLVRLARYASVAVPDAPTSEFLDRLRGLSARVCPLDCGPGRIEDGGRCVARPPAHKKPEAKAAPPRSATAPAAPSEAPARNGPKDLDKIIAIQTQCAAQAGSGDVRRRNFENRRKVFTAVRCARGRGGFM